MDVTARFVDVSGEETNACESLELSTLAKYVPQYWLFLDSPGISKTEMRNYLGNKALWGINSLTLYALLDYARGASMLKSMDPRLESTASRIGRH